MKLKQEIKDLVNDLELTVRDGEINIEGDLKLTAPESLGIKDKHVLNFSITNDEIDYFYLLTLPEESKDAKSFNLEDLDDEEFRNKITSSLNKLIELSNSIDARLLIKKSIRIDLTYYSEVIDKNEVVVDKDVFFLDGGFKPRDGYMSFNIDGEGMVWLSLDPDSIKDYVKVAFSKWLDV